MFLPLLYRLRSMGVPVGTTEAIALGRALAAGLHGNTVTGYYHVARALLIHHEGHLDAFDRAFAAEYRGVLAVSEEMAEWLDSVEFRRDPVTDELPDLDRLLEEFQQRLREQTERHDGGPYWIGTGGTSPFGQGGRAAGGLSTGSSGGGRAAIHIADARRYQGYRSDVTLDIRQIEVALRRLRAFVREGAQDELDIDATIDATARNAGEIEVVTRPPSRPNTHVVLMIDVGGSMMPVHRADVAAVQRHPEGHPLQGACAPTTSTTACTGRCTTPTAFAEPTWVPDLLAAVRQPLQVDHGRGRLHGALRTAPRRTAGPRRTTRTISGLGWLQILQDHFTDAVWLNPEPLTRWRGTTIEDIGAVLPMFPLTVDGLTEAMALLNRGVRR